jgi:hypothetical protein
MAGYLALTAHWISSESDGCLSLKASLIGFHCINKKKTGLNLAIAILSLLDRAKVTLKVFFFAISIHWCVINKSLLFR